MRTELLAVLHDVRAATRDWKPMLDAVQRVVERAGTRAAAVRAEELTEGKALLQWLADQHFTFLGYRTYDLTADDQLLPVAGQRARLAARRAGRPVGELRRTSVRRFGPRPARRRCSC